MFPFSGDCTDCSNALGILRLDGNYVPGNVGASHFFSLSYSSNKITFTARAGPTAVTGSLPSVLPAATQITFDNSSPAQFLSSSTNGSWFVSDADIVTNGRFAAAPDPATMMVLGTAFASLDLGVTRRRA